jgi:exodeoxyribonuclease VII large subunit
VRLQDGLQVVVFAEISVYEARGNYQLIVRVVVEDGIGRLQREFEALKLRLAAEGLFGAERKLRIPRLPRTIAFITSPTGAAAQDFIRILSRRGWRGRLVILPAKVQGIGSAEEMVEMLKLADALGVFDLLVIGRGGGSLEDLWAFNEEILVRAVAASRIPIISAVGHEIDFTLCDFAAALRAETPSAAAELITSNFVAQLDRLVRADAALLRLIDLEVETKQERVAHASSRLRLLSPLTVIERGYLRLDDFSNRLHAAASARTVQLSERIRRLAERVERRSPETRVQFESQHLLALWKRLQSVSPQSVLNRGFVIVRDEDGKPIQRKADLQPDQPLYLEFGDGRAEVHTDSG